MLSLKALSRLVVIISVSALVLAGCTLRPVYDADPKQSFALSYSSPSSTTEQALIQQLAFKLGRSDNPVYKLSFSTSTSSRSLFAVGSQFLRSESEAKVTSTFTLIDLVSEEEVARATRFGTAIYQSNPQNVASKSAVKDANKRAALDVARQFELLIASAISEHQR